MCATPPSFIPILLKLHRCFDNASKICMCFGCNSQGFFSQFELSHFSGIYTMKVNGHWCTTPPTVYAVLI